MRDLTVEFPTGDGVVSAVNGVGFDLAAGETLAILGESGSGKSVTAQAVMGLIERPGRVVAGSVVFGGVDLLAASGEDRRRVRGSGLAMVFQDPLSALNPVWSVGFQIGELFRVHRGLSRQEARRRAVELLDRVRIPAAAQRVGEYPHQFSGGMRQRVMIAMALALDPKVLIADEPTTALDVTVQAQILELLDELRAETGMGLLLITHDLGVVAETADRVAVMYAGRIVETGPTDAVLSVAGPPLHGRPAGLGAPRPVRPGRTPAPDHRSAAQPREDPAGLPVPSSLPLRHRPVPRRAPAARAGRRPTGRSGSRSWHGSGPFWGAIRAKK